RHTRSDRDWSSDVCSSDLITLYLLGLSYSRANTFPKAIATLERAIAKTPNDVNSYRELGYDYEKTKQYAKAFTTYQKALTVAPRSEERRVGKEGRARCWPC